MCMWGAGASQVERQSPAALAMTDHMPEPEALAALQVPEPQGLDFRV